MAKSSQTKEIEFHPDAWKRFERAVEAAAKAPPQHSKAKKLKIKAAKRSKTPKSG